MICEFLTRPVTLAQDLLAVLEFQRPQLRLQCNPGHAIGRLWRARLAVGWIEARRKPVIQLVALDPVRPVRQAVPAELAHAGQLERVLAVD